METTVEQTLYPGETPGADASLPDLREERYQLAIRLADNLWLGESIRVLEALGDYRDCPALLRQMRELKAYSDDLEARRRAEDRRRAQERAQKEARERRTRRALIAAAVVIVVIALSLLR